MAGLKFKSRFLLHSIAKALLLPPVLAHVVLRAAGGVGLPAWLKIVAYAASIPVAQYIRGIPANRARRRDMARLGAHPVPRVKGWLPGNLDVLWNLVVSDGEEYCAETMRKHAETLKSATFDMGILWASQVPSAVDPANVQHVLATSFNDFEKGVKFRDMFDLFLGQGIFTTDGEQWKEHRALAKPFFSRERITDFRCFDRHADKMLHVMALYANHGDPMDIQARIDSPFPFDIFCRFSMDVGTDFLFGRCVKSLDALICHDDSFGRFSTAFNAATHLGATRVRIGSLWPLFEPFGDHAAPAVNIIRDLIDPIIQDAIRQVASLQPWSSSLIYPTLDVELVRAEVMNILLAARDTMASILTFTIYCLTQHPGVQDALRHEVERVVGESREPTHEDIREMRYLRAVLNEVLRLFPPVPFNIRRSAGSSAPPSPLSPQGPLYMPANVSITFISLLIHRRTDIWGPSAHKFDPERWLGPSEPGEDLKTKVHVANPFAFLPFNAGPRICLGQQFAYAEASFIIIRLLQRVKSFELAPEAQPEGSLPPADWASSTIGRESIERCRPVSSLVLSIKGGLWIRAKMKEGYAHLHDGNPL
ncbi:cytochrome P450 [Exidia glandulosa HHB12029]|uniref:Cytochrome P450 n=1 Tax=Exidia glandulosa HHB12029 TaxID=1314781 RepID=A0A165IXR0_EXIGL|nr:cytochrome P450 [Exidia glandulosa HHB12029]